MKEIDPFNSDGSALQLHHLAHNKRVMEDFEKKMPESYPFVIAKRRKGIHNSMNPHGISIKRQGRNRKENL